MSISLGANGGSYSYPQENDPAGWGDDATNWASAVSAALGNIGLGGTVSTTALIDMSGTTTKGFLPPKLTTVQRNAISTPPAGLVIYNTTTSQLEVYTGSSWFSVASNIDGNLTVNGNSTLNGTLTVTGTTSLASVTGTGLTVNGALTVTGATSLQSVTSTGSTVNGVLSVTGNTTLVNVTGANITSTGTILAASGTSGTPGISFSDDTNTGFYSISDNVIGVATNGTRVGQIGVGYGGFTGNIIQVVSTTKTDTSTFSSSFGDIAGLSVSITPRYSTSKVLIMAHISFGKSADIYQFFKLLRDSTDICIADAAATRTRAASAPMLTASTSVNVLMQSTVPIMFLDSPGTTSATTYKIQGKVDTGTGYINRSGADGNDPGYGRATSTIMVMEVQQ